MDAAGFGLQERLTILRRSPDGAGSYKRRAKGAMMAF